MYEVVVDHAGGLHERIADGRADELEAASLQILAQCSGFHRQSRDFLRRLPFVLYRLAADELPNVGVETAELLLYSNECPGVLNGGFDLQPVANDAGIREELADFRLFI